MSDFQWNPATLGPPILWPSNGKMPSVLANTLPQPLVTRASHVALDAPQGRAKLWEIAAWLHCSIIGTCLTTSELRHILVKLAWARPEVNDHEAHKMGVTIAGRHDSAGKMLHKALDARHKLSLNSFAKARTPAEIRHLWKAALDKGDIPGAYWAVMTHQASNRDLIAEVFGEVHMLSHLVGAANRADIRRLRDLEAANAVLEEKLQRQQHRLRDSILERDATISDLRATLSTNLINGANRHAPETERALRNMVADLEARLGREAERRRSAEQKLSAARVELQRERLLRHEDAQSAATMRAALDLVEQHFAVTNETAPPATEMAQLNGISILYVGGRPQTLATLRGLATRLGATMLEHDGGVEDNDAMLAGLIQRADVVMFPVDCVSHSAVGVIKRTCKKSDRPFVALRSASASAFLAGLARLDQMMLPRATE